MLQKYAIAWNECAIAFKDLQLWSQASEAFQNSIDLYNKLGNKVQLAFVIGDYYLCLLWQKHSSVGLSNNKTFNFNDQNLDFYASNLIQTKHAEVIIYAFVAKGALT